MAIVEPEVLVGRRAFPMAQSLLAGTPADRAPRLVKAGWFGTEVEREQGSFALVRDGAGLDDLVGEVLKLSAGEKVVFVYVLGVRGIPTDIALARRAFLSMGRLSLESIDAIYEVVG